MFLAQHARYNTPYYQREINKMLNCGSEATGFAVFQCLSCGQGQHKAHFSCKGNPNMLGRWIKEADNEDGHAFVVTGN